MKESREKALLVATPAEPFHQADYLLARTVQYNVNDNKNKLD